MSIFDDATPVPLRLLQYEFIDTDLAASSLNLSNLIFCHSRQIEALKILTDENIAYHLAI